MAAGAQLDVAGLLERATKVTGLADFGDPWFLEPLRDIVEMINAEAGLHSRDEPPVHWLVGNLADRLRLVDFIKQHPDVVKEKVEVAGIIIGLGRGGSTLLQRLLCTSSRLNHTPWWEVVFPLPLPGEQTGDPTPRIELGRKLAQGLNETWPEMVAMHPVEALAPDEEIMLIDRTLLSLMYCFYFYVPSYMPWLRRQDHRKAYAELETWLKVLQYQTPSRRGQKWLLKSGHHLLAGHLPVMLETFPQAKAIMTHRSLENVIVSYCSMQDVTIRKYSSTLARNRLGPQAIDVFQQALERLLQVRASHPAELFVDVRYQDTVSRPLDVHRSTMHAMGLGATEADEHAAHSWMASHGRETHPRHVYRAEDYGVSREEIARSFNFYHDKFLRAA